MKHLFADTPVRVLFGYKVGDDPSSTKVMLMLSEGAGNHTETFDLQDIDSWLTEHHPEVYSVGEDGKKQLDLSTVTSEVLAPCLKHCRTKRREQDAAKGVRYEIGHLVDAHHPYLAYASGGKWGR
jgi:hypothetical protein